jgi:hypothetical protein
MDHLTEQKNTPTRIFVECAVADLNGVFYSVAKSKVAGEIKCYGAEIETAGAEILLSGIP